MIRRPADAIAAVAILAVVAAYLAFGLMTASTTLGCDFLAYYNASVHWLQHAPIYDLGVAATGTCGTYQYPPPFVLLAAPFSFFGFDAGNWLWIAALIGAWAVGTAILPVRTTTRWMVLLLGAIGWPLIFGVRIGQVTPLLYLVFAVAWRSLDRPRPLGASIAIGALIKLQPGLIALWLVVNREWRALAFAGITVAIVVAGAAAAGLWDWIGFVTLLRSLTNAVTIDTNMALGATLHSLGLGAGPAGVIQTMNTIVIVALVIAAGLWLPRTPGFLVAVLATQLVSPIVWSHYALLLLLPVAWLLDRRQWWAAVIPAIHVWILLPFVPNWTYAAAFYGTLVALWVVGSHARSDSELTSDPAPATASEPATRAEPAT
jgi:alpha-1,2-mannosyltransferase